MRFLHLTDIHFLKDYPVEEHGYFSIFKEMTSPIEQLKKGLQYIDLENVEAVVLTGDLTENGTAEDYRVLKKHLQALFKQIPIIVTLGNHDNRGAFYEGWLNKAPSDKPYNTVTCIGNTTFIGLDTSDSIQQDGLLTQEHCQWLEKALEAAKGTDIVLMMHHHVLKQQATIPPLPNAEALRHIVEVSDVVAILCGHTHHAYKGVFGTKSYITASNLSFSGVDEGEGIVRFEINSGFNDCIVQNGEIMVKYITADENLKLLAKVKFK